MDFQPIKKFALVSLSALVLAACESTPTTDDEFAARGSNSTPSTQATGSSVDSSGVDTSGVSGSAVSGSSVSSSAENAVSKAKDAAMTALTVFYFDFDKSDVSAEAMNALKAHAAYLTANAGAKVNLAGHADERGTREYNLALGERRGKAVASVLLAEGVAPSQIEVISYGEEKPAVLGSSESDMAKNRRVELSY